MAKKKTKKVVNLNVKNKKKNNFYLLVVAIVVIALVAVFALYTNSKTIIGGTNQGGEQSQGQGQQTSPSLRGDACKRDLECQLASCKSTPSVVECINSTHQDLYYKKCKSFTDVKIEPYDFARCACIQSVCSTK